MHASNGTYSTTHRRNTTGGRYSRIRAGRPFREDGNIHTVHVSQMMERKRIEETGAIDRKQILVCIMHSSHIIRCTYVYMLKEGRSTEKGGPGHIKTLLYEIQVEIEILGIGPKC